MVIIVDVLSFSTNVDVAVGQGAIVFPYHWKDDGAAEFAGSNMAELADQKRVKDKLSLSPASLLAIKSGTCIVLPSPNGAKFSLAARPATVLAGCLRNACAVAMAAMKLVTNIAVIPAGERWKEDHSLRVSFEDLISAEAIITHLTGKRSPEAVSATAAFQGVTSGLTDYISECNSGRELIERKYSEDVHLASQLNVSVSVPILLDDPFMPFNR